VNIVKPSYEILGIFPGEEDCLQWLERIGRTCYKSEDRITAESAPKFVRNILKLDRLDTLEARIFDLVTDVRERDIGTEDATVNILNAVKDMLADPPHESVIEHSMMTVRFIFDRGISHEMVRHRLCAFSQESTRYCNYNKGDQGINVIDPCFWDDDSYERQHWYAAMETAQAEYQNLIREGAKPQEARSVLPNSLKTEIVVTANFREWRHIFRLRTSKRAHPQIREVVVPLLRELKAKPNLGLLFEDIPDPEDV
jgi:thymidylate synthase (FAD)